MSRVGPWRTPRTINPTRGTHTRDGFIPHLHLVYEGGVLDAPVKLWPPVKGETLPRPQKRDGKLLFALPGGGEFAV